MSIDDLDLILKKDPIISTWPARSLGEKPEDVEKDYVVHARTHLSLGDTAKYVDTAFKWVSGANKGAFIGAVLGEYGEGKTSFLVHIWAQSREQQICAIPPFEWSAFEEIVDATSGWVRHLLRDTRPELAKRMQRVHERFRQQTTEELARATAADTKQDYESVLETVRALVDSGSMRLTEMSAARLIDLVAEASEIVQEAGYKGLLVLLDEPEVAAKKLGSETVQHFLFDLSNELHRRQGNYGVFLSMPGNFFASAQARFSALPARLEVRGCFPRLGDIHGADFAEVLWGRYVEEFDLGKKGHNLVSSLALMAIGQVGASENRHLSYGPRSVVSAFKRMVDCYQETDEPYQPSHFVRDILDQEILVKPDYRSKILAVQRSPDVNDENREPLMLLAAFPSGLRNETLQGLEIGEVLRPLSRSGGLVHRTAYSMGLRVLRAIAEGGEEGNLLRDMIEEIDGEYAPDRRAFQSALGAFARDVIPLIFDERKGQQLVGWQTLEPSREVSSGVLLGTMVGAFQSTARRFPSRVIAVTVSGLGIPTDDIELPPLDEILGQQGYDLILHLKLRWQVDQALPAQTVALVEDPENVRPACIHLCLDVSEHLVRQEYLAELVGADRMTLLWVLNLLERMKGVELPRETEAEWRALRDMILRQLPGLLLDEEFDKAVALVAAEKLEERPTGSGKALLETVTNLLLARRYPDYDTLIRQPHWQGKIDAYSNALSSSDVPLACKRGRDPWRAEGDLASRVLGTSRMNLTGGAFEGYESLIEIESKGAQAPLKITFHVHPLEQGIRDMICSQPTGADRKLKRDGKECWYMPVADVLPVIMGKGYTVEELNKIIEIGRARQTFDVTTRHGEQVLYCVPLDLDELKAQLYAKLEDLVEEIAEYRQLEGYITRFDPAVMKESIENIQDDADYDRLRTRMNKEFEQNHSRLPGYFDRVQEKLMQLRSRVKTTTERVLGSREVAQLALPSAKSPWGAALGRYIVPNLKHGADQLRKDAKALCDQVDGYIIRFAYSQQRVPQENLKLLREGWSAANDAESRGSELCVAGQSLLRQLADFGKWGELLRQSDDVYERLLELQKDPEHQAKAKALLGEFDRICQEIADFLELRNVAGLADHQQFARRFEELEAERQGYLAGLKGSFDRCKDRVNQLLVALNLDGRVDTVFNPGYIANCYEELFAGGAATIGERALDRALAEMAEQERELTYARDILRAVEPKAAELLLAGLTERSQTIDALRATISKDWLQALVESDDQEQEQQQVAQQIAAAFESARKIRLMVRDVTVAKVPGRGRAKKMYDMIPEQEDIDIKDLVLQMMSQVDDPSQALDASLESLVDLFRQNCIQIKVKRRHK